MNPTRITRDDLSPGGNGPYRIFFSRSPGTLVEVGGSAVGHFNSGQLEMGTPYWWQVLDASDNDLTPGGGPATFTTDIFRPDTRVAPALGGVPSRRAGSGCGRQTTLAARRGRLALPGAPCRPALHCPVVHEQGRSSGNLTFNEKTRPQGLCKNLPHPKYPHRQEMRSTPPRLLLP
jgi:hypothetical protein